MFKTRFISMLVLLAAVATGAVAQAAAPALNLTSPAVGQVIGDDGKNYDYASLPGGVTAVAKICYVSGSNGLALALADEGQMNWSTAMTTAAAHTPAFTGGTWKLATKDEWTNMITAAGSYTALRDGFTSVGGSNLQSGGYWSSTEKVSSVVAEVYNFYDGSWGYVNEGNGYRVRACLAFEAQGSDPEPTYTVTLKEGTEDATHWTIAPAEATTTGVAAGTTVTATYSGTKKVKSVKAKKMAPAVAEGHALSASVVGDIVGTDGKAYAAADKDNLPSGVTAVAMVAYKSATAGSSLAIALANEGWRDWSSAMSTCAGKAKIDGHSWKLPSQAEWKQMFSAFGGNENSYTGLNNALSAAGGASSTLQNGFYWSSSEVNGDTAWNVRLVNGGTDWFNFAENKEDPVNVRACLAF